MKPLVIAALLLSYGCAKKKDSPAAPAPAPAPAPAEAPPMAPTPMPPPMVEAQPAISGIGIRPVMNEKGFAVGQVFPGSPAEAGGLQVGDVVVSVNGESTARWSLEHVSEMLRGPVGSEIKLAIERAGEAKDVTLTRRQLVVPPPPG